MCRKVNAFWIFCSLALGLSQGAWAAVEEVQICYNYSCAATATVKLERAQLERVRALFKRVKSAEEERAAIADAMGLFEVFAGEQTPTWVDQGGNFDDDGRDGRMDCIDNSINMTTYLNLVARRGWLRFHQLLERKKRAPWLFDEHWTAVIQEMGSEERFAVDSWFYENGRPAVILPLQAWLRGAGP